MTPLLPAVMRDHVPSVKVLLENGANIEKPGPDGSGRCSLAVAENKYEAAKALIDAGADVKRSRPRRRLTPLMIAAGQTSPAEGAMFCPAARGPTISPRGCSSAAPT